MQWSYSRREKITRITYVFRISCVFRKTVKTFVSIC